MMQTPTSFMSCKPNTIIVCFLMFYGRDVDMHGEHFIFYIYLLWLSF